jgi:2'-5' RNA ligase
MRRIVIRKLVKPPRWGIAWLPEFSAQTTPLIANIRNACDPLADLLPPHVWLVFPFAAHLNATQLTAHIRRRTARWPQVPVVFSGIRNLKDEFVLLNARTGASSITALHDKLYGGILAQFLRDDIEYAPHVTLARSRDPRRFQGAMESAQSTLHGEYRAVMRTLSLFSISGEGAHLAPSHRVTEVARIALG